MVAAENGRSAGRAFRAGDPRLTEPRRTLALMAARFFEPQPETIVAVTGTSGKTSVADFTRQIFTALGRQAASLGTIGVVKPDGAVYGSLTTPDPVTLHQTAERSCARGRDACGARSLVARARPVSSRRGEARGGRLYATWAAITSTITRRSKPISRPSSGCSRICFRRGSRPSSMRMASAPRMSSRPRGRAGLLFYGRFRREGASSRQGRGGWFRSAASYRARRPAL